MDEDKELVASFEAHRSHLQAVAYRMLGSLDEAEDAVQEAWLRFNRADTEEVANLGGWLTTVVAHLCLDMLRARKTQPEESLDAAPSKPLVSRDRASDPEQEAMLADAVGLAMLVVLDTLTPAERLAFVLHDLFAVPFDNIAAILGRTATATRQLASRARRRVQGADMTVDADIEQQRVVVDAFLTAARSGDFDALLAVLHPDVVQRLDPVLVRAGAPLEIRGATTLARRAKGGAHATAPLLVNGSVGVVVAPQGKLGMVLGFTVVDGKITEMDAIADPARLAQLQFALLTPTS